MPMNALVAAVLTATLPQSAPLEEALDAYVHEASGAPGVAAAVVTPDGVETATTGHARRGEEVTPETLFEIGSVTKVFTGILLADLVREDRTSLDTPVGELLPEPWEPDPDVASITLRELATHTSGLPRLPPGAGTFLRLVSRPSDPYRGLDRDDLFGALEALDPEALETRGEWAYSNLGPALLGRALETPGGEPYETLVTDRVLTPLGLDDTGVTQERLESPRLAQGHRENLRRTPHWTLDAYNPSGGLSSSLHDMVSFLEAAMAADPGDPLGTTLEVHAGDEAADQASGLGWVHSQWDGEPTVWHNGRTGGFYAFVGFQPERERGVVLLMNAGRDGDGFARSLLAGDGGLGDEGIPWFGLALTVVLLGMSVVTPLSAWSRVRGGAPGAGAAPSAARVHVLGAAVDGTLFLALVWKLGAWRWVPSITWWVALAVALGLLTAGARQAGPLPWLPREGPGRSAARAGGVALSLILLGWVLFRL